MPANTESAAILTWQERYAAQFSKSTPTIRPELHFAEAEIADLRAALAAPVVPEPQLCEFGNEDDFDDAHDDWECAQRYAVIGAMEYNGNTVSYMYSKAKNYGNVVSQAHRLIGKEGHVLDTLKALIAERDALKAAPVVLVDRNLNKHFTPMQVQETRVYLGRSGGFDVRDCPEPEALAQFIAASCNAAAGVAPAVQDAPSDEQIRLLREMLSFAVSQNECDMLMTGEECRKARKVLERVAAPVSGEAVRPDLEGLKRYSCFEQEDGIYESKWGSYVLFCDVEALFAKTTGEKQ